MATVAQLAERALRRLGVAVVPAAERPSITAVVSIATIATAALQELGVIAAEETPAPADQALAEDKARTVHASLAATGTINWSETAIPKAVAEDYIKLTASMAASTFGKQADPQIVALLEARVKRWSVIFYAPDLAVDAVTDVHNGLVATGRVRWTTQDIPDGANEPYVVLACMALAPTFGVQFDARLAVVAQIQLAKIVAVPPAECHMRVAYF